MKSPYRITGTGISSVYQYIYPKYWLMFLMVNVGPMDPLLANKGSWVCHDTGDSCKQKKHLLLGIQWGRGSNIASQYTKNGPLSV